MLDVLARGLAELGHEVLYALAGGEDDSLPEGVVAATERSARGADVVHHQRLSVYESGDTLGRPWVRSIHSDLSASGYDRNRLAVAENWIYVSRALARIFGSERWVHNGVDPDELIFSASKGDDFLFVASLDRAWEKGLDVAVDVAGMCGRRLVVAGSASNAAAHERAAAMCRGRDVRFAGEISGTEKAELFAHARAVLVPSRTMEAFGLTCIEAFFSGTPVICSDRGGLPEIVTSETGFVCRSREEFLAAAAAIGSIDPDTCRARALQHFHYLRMAERYAAEYETAIDAFTRNAARCAAG
jgi:glycosyltransferase involved in cell wall biosynthesis